MKSMLSLDLEGKLALVAGVADDLGYGWAIAKALKRAGARVIVATWPPALNLFKMALEQKMFDTKLGPGEGEFAFEKIYPLDAHYDQLEDVPDDVYMSKPYQDIGDYTIGGLRDAIVQDFGAGQLSIVVHSLAHTPEPFNILTKTTRKAYLTASSASAYSFVGMVGQLSPIMKRGGSFLSLSFLAAERAIPGYGGGMNSAKAALESDTKTLAFEVGRGFGHRVNTIVAGPRETRASAAVGQVSEMIKHFRRNSALDEELTAAEVGNAAAFLSSDLAQGITASLIHVDKGMHNMGVVFPIGGNQASGPGKL